MANSRVQSAGHTHSSTGGIASLLLSGDLDKVPNDVGEDKGSAPFNDSPLFAKTQLSNTQTDEEVLPEHVRSAFDVFNDLSSQLTDSYEMLENRVADLTEELNTVSEQRMQELKDKEQMANRLEHLINFLPGGVVVLDQRGVVVDINPTAENMLEPNLKGQLWREAIKRCFYPKSDDGYEVSNHQGKRINIATRSLSEDGQIILLTDQTETRRLQEKLSRHDRLSALGKMVSTLAHQVRTPLSSAMLYGSHLLNESLSSDQQYQFTKKLVNRLHEMERQVSDMLLFVKPDIALIDRLQVADFHHQLIEVMEMPLYQYGITCRWQVLDDDTYIVCNKDALIGAILNLVNNSLQAIPKDQRHENSLSLSIRKKSDEVLSIVVRDQGLGITDESRSLVNELFFTTKPQGTGIGLSVVQSVAKSHGGYFSLTTNQPQGVCAELSLPIINNRSNA